MRSQASTPCYTLLLSSLCLTYARPATEISTDLHATPSHVFQNEHQSRTSETIEELPQSRHPVASTHRSPMSRRWLLHLLGNNWEVIHEHVSVFLPPEAVAPILTEFYKSIMDSTLSTWIHTEAESHFRIIRGLMELELWSPTGMIPWLFVHDLGGLLLRTTTLGYLGRFNAIFINDVIGSTIVVAMRFNEVATGA